MVVGEGVRPAEVAGVASILSNTSTVAVEQAPTTTTLRELRINHAVRCLRCSNGVQPVLLHSVWATEKCSHETTMVVAVEVDMWGIARLQQ
jgi:hypothetical protein